MEFGLKLRLLIVNRFALTLFCDVIMSLAISGKFDAIVESCDCCSSYTCIEVFCDMFFTFFVSG